MHVPLIERLKFLVFPVERTAPSHQTLRFCLRLCIAVGRYHPCAITKIQLARRVLLFIELLQTTNEKRKTHPRVDFEETRILYRRIVRIVRDCMGLPFVIRISLYNIIAVHRQLIDLCIPKFLLIKHKGSISRSLR